MSAPVVLNASRRRRKCRPLKVNKKTDKTLLEDLKLCFLCIILQKLLVNKLPDSYFH